MNRNDIESVVIEDDYLKSKLFFKGFLITDYKDLDYDRYPFYGNWVKTELNEHFILMRHKKIPLYMKPINNDGAIGILGHAYNPVRGLTNEDDILIELASLYHTKDCFFESVNELTGVFCLFVVKDNYLAFLSDAVGLMSIFYSMVDAHTYVSSHVNLIGDVLNLKEDTAVTKLKNCRTFRLFGNQLPGNITPYSEVKRLNPNHYAVMDKEIKQVRFYWPHSIDKSVLGITSELIDILQKTMSQIAEKWQRPAISLTGGCDSKTTLASACNNYHRFRYFSYDSQPNELPDAQAAAQICKVLGLHHTLYQIPYDDVNFENIEGVRSVLLWNGGNVRYNNPNDVRKRLYLDGIDDFDIEVKSWVSEIGRSRYTKRYNGRRNFGTEPTPRKCTTFYKFLFFNRGLVFQCDKYFDEYLKLYFEADIRNPIPWQDQIYWEWHWPSRDGVNLIAEQMFSNDITIPYNNRRILELLLSVPEEDRINDTVYTMIRRNLDDRIDKVTDTIVDVNHTNKRAICEDLYYIVNNILP